MKCILSENIEVGMLWTNILQTLKINPKKTLLFLPLKTGTANTSDTFLNSNIYEGIHMLDVAIRDSLFFYQLSFYWLIENLMSTILKTTLEKFTYIKGGVPFFP